MQGSHIRCWLQVHAAHDEQCIGPCQHSPGALSKGEVRKVRLHELVVHSALLPINVQRRQGKPDGFAAAWAGHAQHGVRQMASSEGGCAAHAVVTAPGRKGGYNERQRTNGWGSHRQSLTRRPRGVSAAMVQRRSHALRANLHCCWRASSLPEHPHRGWGSSTAVASLCRPLSRAPLLQSTEGLLTGTLPQSWHT